MSGILGTLGSTTADYLLSGGPSALDSLKVSSSSAINQFAAKQLNKATKSVINAHDAQSIQNPFKIGDFLLVGVEIPQQLDSVGGDQMLAVHNFPGGIRTIQSLGAFPPDVIRWDGVFLGSNAWNRAYQLDRFRIDGKKIPLTFGKWKFEGKIESFHVYIRNEWYCTYHLEFVPSKDLSSPPAPVNTSQAVEQLHQAFAAISGNIPVSVFGDLLPSTLTGFLANMVAYGQQGLLYADNVLNVVDPSIANQVSFYADSALSLGNSILEANSVSGLTLSAAASIAHVLSYAGIVKNLYTTVSPIQQMLSLINPNLLSLAASYYGDASRWVDLAYANGLTDPFPQGQYNIQIPSSVPPQQNPGRYS